MMTKINDDLTILLTTKGRHLHTLRWMWHANRVRLPFHIFIADGEPNQNVVNLLTNKDTFPNISYQHQLYEDLDFSCYYKKVEDALSRVKTEFVMFSDNDDFLLPSGIEKSVNFLKHNSDHVGASGRIGWFHLNETPLDGARQLVGAPTFLFPSAGGYAPRSLDQNNPRARVISGLTPYTLTWYSVFRTKYLSLAASECSKINFYSLNNVEAFLHLRMLSLGSIHFDQQSSSYIRQKGTSQGSGNYDIFSQVLNGSHSYDIKEIIQLISSNATESDKEKKEMANELFAIFRDRLIERLRTEFPFIPRLLRHMPVFRRRYLYGPASSIIKMMLTLTSKDTYRRKAIDPSTISNVEDLYAIKSTLANPDLREFLERQDKPGASSGCNARPGKERNEPPHRESSLGLMEATTWAQHRQSGI